MTKEITKAKIMQEMQDKFKLREFEPEVFTFSEVVIPTYDVGQHLLTPQIKSTTVSVTSATSFIFFTVPENEKWHLHGYNVIFVTGSYKIAGAMIRRPLITDYMYLDLTLNQTVSYAKLLPQDIVLLPNEKIVLYVDDYTSTGDLLMIVDVTVEEIR